MENYTVSVYTLKRGEIRQMAQHQHGKVAKYAGMKNGRTGTIRVTEAHEI